MRSNIYYPHLESTPEDTVFAVDVERRKMKMKKHIVDFLCERGIADDFINRLSGMDEEQFAASTLESRYKIALCSLIVQERSSHEDQIDRMRGENDELNHKLRSVELLLSEKEHEHEEQNKFQREAHLRVCATAKRQEKHIKLLNEVVKEIQRSKLILLALVSTDEKLSKAWREIESALHTFQMDDAQ